MKQKTKDWLNSRSIVKGIHKVKDFILRHTVDLILLVVTIPVGISGMINRDDFLGAFILLLGVHQAKCIFTNEVTIKQNEQRKEAGSERS